MVPVVFREGQFEFRFYSGDKGEPPHIHVRHSSVGRAKFWLEPEVSLEHNHRMRARDVREV